VLEPRAHVARVALGGTLLGRRNVPEVRVINAADSQVLAEVLGVDEEGERGRASVFRDRGRDLVGRDG
jgi:hypothetical protein